jgi:VanZ family protein
MFSARNLAQVLAWLGALALAIASWTEGDYMVRTGMNTLHEHATAYFLTAIAFMVGYPDRPLRSIALGLSVYAAVLEAGQLLAPGRHPSLVDWSWSVSGVLAACFLLIAWRALASKWS